ncbi:MAG TPA: hypothetical protein VGP95_06820 [Gemmatimonadaceae bacterium]|jgi:hypothetical protein|nr:hypothetical protein [Gemmatimonadaceae bacterium]
MRLPLFRFLVNVKLDDEPTFGNAGAQVQFGWEGAGASDREQARAALEYEADGETTRHPSYPREQFR